MHSLTITFRCHGTAENRARYFLDLFSSITDIRFVPVSINADLIYGEPREDEQYRMAIKQVDYVIEQADWALVDAKSRLILPSFVSPDLAQPSGRRLEFDIFSIMFEFMKTGLLNHGDPFWHPGRFSTTLRYVYPFFDSYIDCLLGALKASALLPQDFSRPSPWPENAEFAVGLSHDIDIFRRKVPGSLVMLAKSVFSDEIPGGFAGSIRGLADSVTSMLPGVVNPYRQLSKWREIEDAATYFVFSGKRRSRKDPKYKPAHVARRLRQVDSKSYEIGLHNGIGTFGDPEHLAAQKQRLAETFKAEILGIRPHYLDCRYPAFWRSASDFEYASSVGSDAMPGFTSGINFPFFGFDFDTAERLDVLELPIGLMDCALFGIENDAVRERSVDTMIKTCRANHGLLVLDWHNRTAYEPDFPGWFNAYCSILEKARAEGAYLAPLGQIARWWRKRCASVFSS